MTITINMVLRELETKALITGIAFGDMVKVTYVDIGHYKYYWVAPNKFAKFGLMWQQCTRDELITRLKHHSEQPDF